MEHLKKYIYDFECYYFEVDSIPVHFLSCSFLDIDNEQEFYFEISNRINQKEDLIKFFLQKDICLIGYNNISYDSVILQLLIEYKESIDWLVEYTSVGDFNKEEKLKYYQSLDPMFRMVKYIHCFTQNIFTSKYDAEISDVRNRCIVPQIDLMTMYYQNGFQKPLKMVGAMLNSTLIYEGNIESNKKYTLSGLKYNSLEELFEDKKMYNMNDVRITYDFYKYCRTAKGDKLDMRYKLSKKFDLDLHSSSESSIANKLILRLYCTEVLKNRNTDESIFKSELERLERKVVEMRTFRESFLFDDAIVNKPNFESDYLKQLSEKIYSTKWTKNLKFNEVVHIGNLIGKIGRGGIHLFQTGINRTYKDILRNYFPFDLKTFKKANEIPVCYKKIPKDKLVLEVDVASLHPTTWVNSNMYPEHLGKEFIVVYKRLKDERIVDKKQGNMFDSDWKKLVLNSCFGKTENEHSFLHDTKVFFMITMTGQLMLLALMEQLLKLDAKLLLSNTDSIVLELNKSEYESFRQVCKEWERNYNYELEETIYERYFARDVNSYLGKTINGKIKMKNDFSDEIDLSKGMDAIIVAKAAKEYLINDANYSEIIQNETDIQKFLITYKPDSSFFMEYTTIEDGSIYTRIVQRINRWYISKRFGKLFSVEVTPTGDVIKRDRSANLYLQIHNDLRSPIKEINYDYYIGRTKKLIESVEVPQTALF